MDVFLDEKEYCGDVFSLLEQAEHFIKNHINLKGEINGLQRTDSYEIPVEAMREALLNAFVHRDYSNKGRDIKLGVYDDVVNIVSPGGFPNTLTQKDILEGRSELRNKVVARVLKELNYIEQWGSGIKRIKSSCLKRRLREPRIRETGDFVDVELYREGDRAVRRVSESIGKYRKSIGNLSEQEREILQTLKGNGRISSKEVQALLQVKEARARRVVKGMVDKGLLEKRGNGRNTFYVLF